LGKVRTSLVKRTARELLAKYPDLFTEDFQHNKKAVSQLTAWGSKKLRNQVAGYVTSLVKLQKKRQQLRAAEEGQATQ